MTRDLDELLAFYADVLGLPVGHTNEIVNGGRVARVHCGDAAVKFVEPVPAPALADPPNLVRTTGIRYLTIIVTNGAQAYAKLEAEGCVVANSRSESESRMMFFVRDPDGNLIEILQHFH